MNVSPIDDAIYRHVVSYVTPFMVSIHSCLPFSREVSKPDVTTDPITSY